MSARQVMSSQEAGVDCSSFPSQHMTSRGGAPSSNGVSSARNTAVDSQRIGQSHPHRRGKQVSQYLLRWHLHPWGFGAHNPMGAGCLRPQAVATANGSSQRRSLTSSSRLPTHPLFRCNRPTTTGRRRYSAMATTHTPSRKEVR